MGMDGSLVDSNHGSLIVLRTALVNCCIHDGNWYPGGPPNGQTLYYPPVSSSEVAPNYPLPSMIWRTPGKRRKRQS